jgi:hypothetical protein
MIFGFSANGRTDFWKSVRTFFSVIQLYLATKSRHPDQLQNYVYEQMAGLNAETLTDE